MVQCSFANLVYERDWGVQFGLGGGGMGGIGVLMVGLSDTLLVVSALDICGRLGPSYQSSGG